MTDKKIIAVVGATGQQGGGLARAILADPSSEFTVRALTRKPGSDAAKALAEAGAEVVEADLDDPSTLKAAFEGVYGAYVVTAFWEYNSPDREAAHARTAVDAVKAAGVKHVIWSTLPDTRELFPLHDDRMPTLHGKYKVPHFDVKGESDQLFLDAGVPTTFLSTSFYFEALRDVFAPRRGDDGKLFISLPMADKVLPGVAAEDIGRTAYGIFKRGTDLVGQTVHLAGDKLTGAQYAAAFSKVFGEEVVYRPQALADMRAQGFPGADEFANTFQYFADAADSFAGARDPEYIRTINAGLLDFESWVTLHQDEFKI
jgi:uncharacterized protein YbjT (DUF2867 family)